MRIGKIAVENDFCISKHRHLGLKILAITMNIHCKVLIQFICRNTTDHYGKASVITLINAFDFYIFPVNTIYIDIKVAFK